MSNRGASAFDPRVVFALILFGALAFFATLYFIGSGQTGRQDDQGGGHAASKGISGYAALVDLLQREGHKVSVSRNRADLKGNDLLILTPPLYAEPKDIAKIIADRRYEGPTLLVLPKRRTAPASLYTNEKVPAGWEEPVGTSKPRWAEELGESDGDIVASTYSEPISLKLAITKQAPTWNGLGRSGKLPDGDAILHVTEGNIQSLVTGADNSTLIGYLDDGGIYPVFEEAAGFDPTAYDDEDYRDSPYGVVIVAEPDLLNNYGMADRMRADLALAVVTLAMENSDLPIVFDVTTNGLGSSENLLTLAFTPPFLAATLCLILALIVVAWRAFKRFGPSVDEGRAIAFGKERLVRNSAAFIQRTRRLHLLSGPYADMMRERIVRALALRRPDDTEIDAVLARRLPDEPPFTQQIAALRRAQSRADILRAADALKTLERKLSR